MTVDPALFTAATASADQNLADLREREPDDYRFAVGLIEANARAVCELLSAQMWTRDFAAGLLAGAMCADSLPVGFVSKYAVTRPKEG